MRVAFSLSGESAGSVSYSVRCRHARAAVLPPLREYPLHPGVLDATRFRAGAAPA